VLHSWQCHWSSYRHYHYERPSDYNDAVAIDSAWAPYDFGYAPASRRSYWRNSGLATAGNFRNPHTACRPSQSDVGRRPAWFPGNRDGGGGTGDVCMARWIVVVEVVADLRPTVTPSPQPSGPTAACISNFRFCFGAAAEDFTDWSGCVKARRRTPDKMDSSEWRTKVVMRPAHAVHSSCVAAVRD